MQIGPYKIVNRVGDPRVETVSVLLGQAGIAEAQVRANQLRDQQDALKQELAGVKQEFRARGQRLIDAEIRARRQASTGRMDVEISLQEFLTSTNEVILVRMDTQEVTGRRTATAEELQQDLFGAGVSDEDEAGFGKSRPDSGV